MKKSKELSTQNGSTINLYLTKEEKDFLIRELQSYIECVNSYYETKVSEKDALIAKSIFKKIFDFYDFDINW